MTALSRFCATAAIGLTAAIVLSAGVRAAPDDVVARVGSQTITERDLQTATSAIGDRYAQLPDDQRRLAVLSALIDMRVLAAKARAEGLDKDPGVASQIEFERDSTLHSAYFAENAKLGDIDEETLRQRYDQMVDAMPERSEVHARHILLDDKAAAEDAIRRLDEGADFAALARELSTGPTASDGGDLGFFSRGQMVPAFEKAAFGLEPGSYTEEPVQTRFGWHVIQVEEVRQAEAPSFEEMRPRIRQMIMRERYTEMVEKARSGETIEYVDPAVREEMQAIRDRAAAGTPTPSGEE